MHAAATLFLDVCVQRDLAPGGAWPLLATNDVSGIATLFAIAGERRIRQGGVVCRHDGLATVAVGAPPHCGAATPGYDRLPDCFPRLPAHVWEEGEHEATTRDRRHALYLANGCAGAPDVTPEAARALDVMLAGIRDVVVFGAGIEHGIDLVVGALLRRRIRTHVALDAVAAADAAVGQLVIARWKRSAVDGATVETIRRLLR